MEFQKNLANRILDEKKVDHLVNQIKPPWKTLLLAFREQIEGFQKRSMKFTLNPERQCRLGSWKSKVLEIIRICRKRRVI